MKKILKAKKEGKKGQSKKDRVLFLIYQFNYH
jgi:hypothetical protein